MEFWLTKKQQVTFSSKSVSYSIGVGANPRSTIAKISLDTTQTANSLTQNELQKLVTKLQSSESRTGIRSLPPGPAEISKHNLDWVVIVHVGLGSYQQPSASQENRNFILLTDDINCPDRSDLVDPSDRTEMKSPWMGGIRKHLRKQQQFFQQVSGSNNKPILGVLQNAAKSLNYHLKLKVTISNFSTNYQHASANRNHLYHTSPQGGYPYFDKSTTLQTLESTVDEFSQNTRVDAASHPEDDFSQGPGVRLFVSTMPNFQQSSNSWTGNISITGILYPTQTQIPGAITSQDRSINKTILDKEIQTDVVLTAKGNIDVKCHRAFLCAHSSVFQTMFKKSYKESTTGTVDLSDMTESGVRAFLAYLYYADVKKANDCAPIALELLKAGHKYDILELEEYMRAIMLAQDESWYDTEVALKLYIFSRKLDNGDDLKVKAVSVLKVYNHELLQSETYKKMFSEDPEATMELVQLAFSVV